jgi:hypothetical protein
MYEIIFYVVCQIAIGAWLRWGINKYVYGAYMPEY